MIFIYFTIPGSSSSSRSTENDQTHSAQTSETHSAFLPPVLTFCMFSGLFELCLRVNTQQIDAPKHLFLPPCSLLLNAISHLKRCGKASFSGCQPVIYRMPQRGYSFSLIYFLFGTVTTSSPAPTSFNSLSKAGSV